MSTGVQLINLSIALGVIDTIAVGLRLLARWRSKKSFAIDDYFVVGSLAPLYGMIASSTLLIERGGLGQPMASLPQGTLETFLKLIMATLVTYSLTITSVKLSLLLLYRRIFSTPAFKAWTLIIGATCVAWLIAAILVDVFQCRPFSAAFQSDLLFTSHCIDLQSFYLSMIAANFVLDIIVLAMPLVMVWRLQLTQRQRLQVSAIVLLGGLGCIAGVMRLVSIGDLRNGDMTMSFAGEYAWSQIEPALAILCGCLMTYRPLFRTYKNKASTPSIVQRPQPCSDWTDMENTNKSRLRFPVADDFGPRAGSAGYPENRTLLEINLKSGKVGLHAPDFSDTEYHNAPEKAFDVTAKADPELSYDPAPLEAARKVEIVISVHLREFDDRSSRSRETMMAL